MWTYGYDILKSGSYHSENPTQTKQCLLRDLWGRGGRVLIAKASLRVEKNPSNNIDKVLCNFVWRNATQYLRKPVLSTLNNTSKINWLKYWQKYPNCTWNVFLLHVISKLGALNFFAINQIPIKISAFHCRTFLSRTLMDTLYRHQSLFMEYRFLNIPPGDYAQVCAVLVTSQSKPSAVVLLSPSDTAAGKIRFSNNPSRILLSTKQYTLKYRVGRNVWIKGANCKNNNETIQIYNSAELEQK